MGTDPYTLVDLPRADWPTVGDYLWIHGQGWVILTCVQDNDAGVYYEGMQCAGPLNGGRVGAQNDPHEWRAVRGRIALDTVFRVLPWAEWPRLPFPGDQIVMDPDPPHNRLRVDQAGEIETPGVWQAFGELHDPDGRSLGDDEVQLPLRTRAG
jgi:hypothetical protein